MPTTRWIKLSHLQLREGSLHSHGETEKYDFLKDIKEKERQQGYREISSRSIEHFIYLVNKGYRCEGGYLPWRLSLNFFPRYSGKFQIILKSLFQKIIISGMLLKKRFCCLKMYSMRVWKLLQWKKNPMQYFFLLEWVKCINRAYDAAMCSSLTLVISIFVILLVEN